MYIKEFKELQFKFRDYYLKDHFIKGSLSFIYLFFKDAYVYIKRQGVAGFLHGIENNKEEDEYLYDSVSLSTDYKNKLIYLHEPQFDYCRHANTPALEKLLDELTPLQACQQNLIEYIVLTQENFNQLVQNWDSLHEETPVPFALLYQDDQGCYDVKSFQTEEDMRQFTTQHIRK